MSRLVLILTLLALPLLASAADYARIDFSKGNIARQKEVVMAEVAHNPVFAGATHEQINVLETDLSSLETLMPANSGPSNLDAAQLAQAKSLQDSVNKLLVTLAVANRKVCTRETPIGSNIAKTVCMSVAERERRREEDKKAMSDGQSHAIQGMKD